MSGPMSMTPASMALASLDEDELDLVLELDLCLANALLHMVAAEVAPNVGAALEILVGNESIWKDQGGATLHGLRLAREARSKFRRPAEFENGDLT